MVTGIMCKVLKSGNTIVYRSTQSEDNEDDTLISDPMWIQERQIPTAQGVSMQIGLMPIYNYGQAKNLPETSLNLSHDEVLCEYQVDDKRLIEMYDKLCSQIFAAKSGIILPESDLNLPDNIQRIG